LSKQRTGTITIDKDLGPIFTREGARKQGWSEETIAKVFGPVEGEKAKWRTLKNGRRVVLSGSGEKRGALTSKGSAIVRNLERDIAKNENETAIFTDVNGNVLYRQEGEETQVEFTSELLGSMRGKNAVMTHNHPLPYGLSGQDLVVAAYYDFAEIRAIAYDADTGEKKLYRMTRPEKGWGDWASRKTADPTWRTVEGIRSIASSSVTRAKYRRRSRKYPVTKKKSIQDAWHETGEAVAHMTGAEYVEEVVQ
jgi:hypothetical protein